MFSALWILFMKLKQGANQNIKYSLQTVLVPKIYVFLKHSAISILVPAIGEFVKNMLFTADSK